MLRMRRNGVAGRCAWCLQRVGAFFSVPWPGAVLTMTGWVRTDTTRADCTALVRHTTLREYLDRADT